MNIKSIVIIVLLTFGIAYAGFYFTLSKLIAPIPVRSVAIDEKSNDTSSAPDAPPEQLASQSAEKRVAPASQPAKASPSPRTGDFASRVRLLQPSSSPPSAPVADAVAPVVISEPVARLALSYVGTDPAAEEVWTQAINDTSLPPDQRKDLIEDLNQDGFDDPRNLTPDDLPLILNRIALIERLAPDAMDDVNAAAFGEAHKDLVNMAARLN